MAWTIAAALTLVALITIAVFYSAGGRWFIIDTPSMGQYAPVGTLVLSIPVLFSALAVGDMVLFSAPNGVDATYFHRIVSIDGTGALHTKGEINGAADPWVVTASDVVGAESVRLVGMGFFIDALPILIIGGLVLHILARYYVERPWRFPTVVVGWAFIVALAMYLTRPLVQATLIVQSVEGGVATTALVPTGLIPIQAHAVHGTTLVLAPGEVGMVESARANAQGLFEVMLAPSVDGWLWWLFVGICVTPLILCIGAAVRESRRTLGAPQPEPGTPAPAQ